MCKGTKHSQCTFQTLKSYFHKHLISQNFWLKSSHPLWPSWPVHPWPGRKAGQTSAGEIVLVPWVVKSFDIWNLPGDYYVLPTQCHVLWNAEMSLSFGKELTAVWLWGKWAGVHRTKGWDPMWTLKDATIEEHGSWIRSFWVVCHAKVLWL